MSDTEYILSDEEEDEALNFPEASASGGPTAVEYSSTASTPSISGQTIIHPFAQASAAGTTSGVMAGVAIDGTTLVPYILNGVLNLPPGISSLNRLDDESDIPQPGDAGWVVTMYHPMLSWNGGADIASFRQLMRIYNGELQVSCQYQLYPSGQPTAWMLIYMPF